MLENLDKKLSEFGLLIRGGFNAKKNELSEIDANAQSLIMVGVAGSSFWPVFTKSEEYISYLDGEKNPLDRWSRRIGEFIAQEFSGQAVYPFEGPPYYPFIEWAKRCESLHTSKMGFSIHPDYGLWHAFRFALLSPISHEGLESPNETKNPCLSCSSSPCLTQCPVNAYTDEGFEVDKCFNYLQQNEDSRCRTHGCIARLSCPEGASYRYQPEHAAFHMKAFFDSQAIRYAKKGSNT